MSKFFVVATPIGNLSDTSPRVLETLSAVDVIFCEDTRVTQKLLSHFNISAKTISFHKHSPESSFEKVLGFIGGGKDCALVSDAGTPAISDPGAFLVSMIRDKFPETEIISIPGPSALTSAISIAGLCSDSFVFLGFPPHKKGRKKFFEKAISFDMPVVFYESRHRILKSLEELQHYCPDRTIFLAKEITKLHEKTFEGKAGDILQILQSNSDLLKGEFVVILK